MAGCAGRSQLLCPPPAARPPPLAPALPAGSGSGSVRPPARPPAHSHSGAAAASSPEPLLRPAGLAAAGCAGPAGKARC